MECRGVKWTGVQGRRAGELKRVEEKGRGGEGRGGEGSGVKWTGVEKWREKGDLRGVECSKLGDGGAEERKQESRI